MNDQRQLLEPFPKRVVKQIPRGGFKADFVSWTDKLQRLYQIAPDFHWQIISVTESGDDTEPVAVHGRLIVEVDGVHRTLDGIGQGRDAKNASTDAFSRACAFAGLGLHLWCQGADKDGGYWIAAALDRDAH